VRKRTGWEAVGTTTFETSKLGVNFGTGKLAVGRPAPEIVGKDLDGKPMKLSDFRGKIVMLDFWGDW